MAVLVRAGNVAFGELNGKGGLVEMLETERETLSTRGTTISWAGVMVKCSKFQARMLNSVGAKKFLLVFTVSDKATASGRAVSGQIGGMRED